MSHSFEIFRKSKFIQFYRTVNKYNYVLCAIQEVNIDYDQKVPQLHYTLMLNVICNCKILRCEMENVF